MASQQQYILFTNISDTLQTLQLSEWCMILLPPILYWIFSLCFFILSKLKIPSIDKYKIPVNASPDKVSFYYVLAIVAIQHIIQSAVGLSLVLMTRSEKPVESAPIFMLKLYLAALIFDTYEYWWHRWMHKNKWLYKHVHSVHHQVYTPYAFSALYNHPFEGFIMDTIGGAIPALILDMHPWCCAVFYSVATLKTVDDHCGYVLPYDPFQLLFQNNTKYHNIHHSGKGQIFNFSQPFFTFWDDFMGSRASSVDVADLKLSKKTD